MNLDNALVLEGCIITKIILIIQINRFNSRFVLNTATPFPSNKTLSLLRKYKLDLILFGFKNTEACDS